MDITISVEDLRLTARLNGTPEAQKILGALPIEGPANTWGDEIYLEIPVELELTADAVQDVEVGTVAYWPTGRALCVFFGPTPVSVDEKPRAYSPVNVIGKILGDAGVLKKIRDGAKVKIQA